MWIFRKILIWFPPDFAVLSSTQIATRGKCNLGKKLFFLFGSRDWTASRKTAWRRSSLAEGPYSRTISNLLTKKRSSILKEAVISGLGDVEATIQSKVKAVLIFRYPHFSGIFGSFGYSLFRAAQKCPNNRKFQEIWKKKNFRMGLRHGQWRSSFSLYTF